MSRFFPLKFHLRAMKFDNKMAKIKQNKDEILKYAQKTVLA